MVTLLYGIAIGIVLTIPDLISIFVGSITVGVCITFAYYETRIMRSVRKFQKETAELEIAMRKTWQAIENTMDKGNHITGPVVGIPEGGYNYPEIPGEKKLTIDEKIRNAIAVQNYELAAKLRDERDKLKEK